MNIAHAELKCALSKNDFLRVYQRLLDEDKKILDMEMKEQIVYFADNKDLTYFTQENIAIRYRRNNRWLEVIVKKRWISKAHLKKIETQFWWLYDHELKVDIDQISADTKMISCVLKCTHNSVHQSFAFYNEPRDFLSDEQKAFIRLFTHHKVESLRFLIPIQSKVFIFPCDYKEFDLIALEERRMPKLFGNKFYEITFKTAHYSKQTIPHLTDLCEKYDIPLNPQGQYKTQWLYNAYFNI